MFLSLHQVQGLKLTIYQDNKLGRTIFPAADGLMASADILMHLVTRSHYVTSSLQTSRRCLQLSGRVWFSVQCLSFFFFVLVGQPMIFVNHIHLVFESCYLRATGQVYALTLLASS